MATEDGSVRRIGVGGDVPDDDWRSDVPMDSDSIFDLFKAEVQKEARKPNVRFKVLGRNGVEVEIDPNVDYDTYDAWVKRATKGKKGGDLDYKRLANAVLSNTCVGIWMNNVQVLDKETKEPMTLSDPAFHRLIEAPIGGTAPAIKKFFGNDGDMVNVTRLAIKEMGYTLDGDEEYESDEDPLLS